MSSASIAINRFGLGARPDQGTVGDPKRWLLDQFARYDAGPRMIATQPSRATVANWIADYNDAARAFQQQKRADMPEPGMTDPAPAPAPEPVMKGKAARRPPNPLQGQRLEGRAFFTDAIAARVDAAVVSPTPFAERLVHFWSNHFAISAEKLPVIALAGSFEFDAIRPHVFGTFGTMLNAVERHPAMLLYLDQAQSVGPNSPVGARRAANTRRPVGLNENLAREIMELHTLGVRTGYSQGDVTEFARAMTGWSVAGLARGPAQRMLGGDGKPGEFMFAQAVHEPGTRTVLGKSFAQGGEAQAAAVLDMLAVHPATARHIATKLATHFVNDTPPPALVARMEAAFLASGGDLPTVYRALIDSPESWAPAAAKFKSPWEWSLSLYRAMGMASVPPVQANALFLQLGQPIWKPGSPAGYEDTTGRWAGPDAIMRRVEAAERIAGRTATSIDVRKLAATLFPDALSPATAQAIARAESPGQGLALLLVAPEMMRR